jgi:hypothetical protein
MGAITLAAAVAAAILEPADPGTISAHCKGQLWRNPASGRLEGRGMVVSACRAQVMAIR